MKIIKDINFLHQVSSPVKTVAEGTKIALKLIKTLEEQNRGIGLSAIQIGIPKNVFVTYLEKKPVIYINPELDCLNEWEIIDSEESCLSLPGVTLSVKRYGTVVVNCDGWNMPKKLKGLEAIVVQHEFDHLRGKLIIDASNNSPDWLHYNRSRLSNQNI